MKLTWDDFFSICQEQKPNQFKPPDWDKVKAAVATTLAVQPSDLLTTKIDELKSKYNKFAASRKNKGSAQRECKDVVLDSKDFNQPAVVPRKKQKKSLDQLGERQLKARTEQIWSKVEEYAEENDETPLRVIALLLKKCKDKRAREFGDSVWQRAEPSSSTISHDAAMAIMVDCQLGRETYSKLRKTLKQQGHNILPPWIKLRTTQTSISPKPQPLPNPHEGVQFKYAESMKNYGNPSTLHSAIFCRHEHQIWV